MEPLQKAFKDRFPELHTEIDLYYEHIARAGTSLIQKFIFSNFTPKWFGALLNKFCNKDYFYYEDKTTQDINDLCFGVGKNAEIKGIITGQFPAHALLPTKASFMMQAGLHRHMARDGGWYPKGGSEILAKRMCECIYKYGGKVLVKTDVQEILVGANGAA